ncbi:ACP-like domain-containing protein [Moraxella catarrhalis]
MNYGFNNQGLPIYAEANLGGKTRFLPINLVESIGELMIFGDDNDW